MKKRLDSSKFLSDIMTLLEDRFSLITMLLEPIRENFLNFNFGDGTERRTRHLYFNSTFRVGWIYQKQIRLHSRFRQTFHSIILT